MSNHRNEAVEGDDGGLVICRGCRATGTYAALPSGECPTPYKPDSVRLKESLAREQALQQRLTVADDRADMLEGRLSMLLRELLDLINDEDGILVAAELSTGFAWHALQKHGKAIKAALKAAEGRDDV